jgi:XTP/dITP diphosphohydrolase
MSTRPTLVLASRNPDKIRELSALFADLPLAAVRSALDYPHLDEVEETGSTLSENALLKAWAVAEETGHPAVADDTGLFVDALDGEPGIFASRYAGEDCSYGDNCRKLLAALEGESAPRSARFKTAMALVDPETGVEEVVEGVLEGEILAEMRGSSGFGYDPLFLVEGSGRTLAEMDLAEKNRISHRAQAARAMHEVLRDFLENREV